MRIQTKLLAILLPLGLASALIISWFSNRAVRSVVRQQESERGLFRADELAGSAEREYRSGEGRSLAAWLKFEQKKLGASYGLALDPGGRLLAATDGSETGKVQRDAWTLAALRASEPQALQRSWREQPVVELQVPVWSSGRLRLGTLRFGLPLIRALDAERRIGRLTMAFTFIVALGAIALAFTLTGRILKRITLLAEAADRIGRGEFGQRVPAAGADEIGDLARRFNKMAKDLEESTVSRELIDRILDNMLDPLIVSDPQSRIRIVNKSALRLLGYKKEELLGGDVSLLFHEKDTVFRGPGLAVLLREGSLQGLDATLKTKGGAEVPAEISAARFDASAGSEGGFIINARDVAQRRAVERELREKTNELARSNSELERFAYVASHDLQEPLRKITAFGDVLKEHLGRGLDAKGAELLERMQKAAERMSGLIQGLLQYSKVAQRSEPFRRVDLGEVLKEVQQDLEILLAQSGGKIEAGPLPAVHADPLQMKQLLQNLVANALKFRREGRAPVVKIAAAGGAGGWVELTIEDNGIGFSSGDVERLFQPFTRLNSVSQYPGSGIGLAICAKIAQRHGGAISASGRPGEGAAFTVRLPAA